MAALHWNTIQPTVDTIILHGQIDEVQFMQTYSLLHSIQDTLIKREIIELVQLKLKNHLTIYHNQLENVDDPMYTITIQWNIFIQACKILNSLFALYIKSINRRALKMNSTLITPLYDFGLKCWYDDDRLPNLPLPMKSDKDSKGDLESLSFDHLNI
ncbi:hypothetical protein BC833DRAFT_585924 [Globomyces pollinis-pini]|nr:hypothetical protein BC833DRAFT_585924 [Globomyces pollinis-pini]